MWLRRFARSFSGGVFAASAVVNGIGIGVVVVLMLLLVADVVLRRFFNQPIRGSYELTQLIMAIVVFFTIAYCAAQKGHVAIEVLVARLPQRLQVVIEILMYLFSLGLWGLLSWGLSLQAINVWRMAETTNLLGLPSYPFVLVAVFGSALLTLVILIQLLSLLAEGGRR